MPDDHILRRWARAKAQAEAESRLAGKEATPKDAANTERLKEYWVHGEGAAKIRWGEPNDFYRCVAHLGKYVSDPKGLCADLHHEALGVWPGREDGGKHGGKHK
jgi:hypothetical protein